MDGDTIIGAIIYGRIAMANVWKKYVKNEKDLIELRRLCCIDDTPKNISEFSFIFCLLRYQFLLMLLALNTPMLS